jgi:hypothetical protein
MELYLSKTHSDENGPFAESGKLGIIRCSKENFLQLSNFFQKVSKELETDGNCHMHFRDYLEKWNKKEHIDIQIDIEK